MATTSIFEEDEVCIPTSSGGFKYGLVVESSEYVSTDDEDDNEDENKVQKGKIKVAWHPSGKETVIAENKVVLTDRSLMPGDVVRRLISGKESQRGFVQECHIKCHVKVLGTEYYIYNIDAKDLKPIQEFDADTEVTMDSWVGHVVEVTEDLTLRFPCGARCKLKSSEMTELQDVNDNRDDYSEFSLRSYYVGQKLAGTYEDYEEAEWLNTSNVRGPKCKVKHLMKAPAVVEEIQTHSVEVVWTCKGFTKSGAGTDQLKSPPECLQGDDLKRLERLDCFQFCHLQIGDTGYYTVKESDTILHKMSPRQHITPDIVEHAAKDNVVIIGTRSDGFIVQQRSVVNKSAPNDRSTNDCHIKNSGTASIGDNQSGLSEDTSGVSEVKGEDGTMSRAGDDDGCTGDDEFEDVEEDAMSDSEGEESGDDSSVHSSPARQSNSNHARNKRRTGFHPAHKHFRRMEGKRGRKRGGKQSERELKAGDRVPVEIWYTFSCCEVRWQDGHVEEKVPSPELFPIHHLDELEFFPGDFVLDVKGTPNTEYGVVMNADYKERTVMVKWIKLYKPGQDSRPHEEEPVEVSVFDLKDHPDYNFRCGSTVLRVGGFEGECEYEAVGQVYTLDPEGTVQVWWPSGNITKCYPQDLFLPGDEDGDSEGESEGDTESDSEGSCEEEGSDVSWETEGEDTASDVETPQNSKNKPKVSWEMNDNKKKELDALLERAQEALTGLLKIFVTASGQYFKNSREIFKDTLAIFKRCKQVEKILKSSFFDDEEISQLMGDIKTEMLKEKARQVVDVYKFRTGATKTTVTESANSNEQNTLSGNKDIHGEGLLFNGDGARENGAICGEGPAMVDQTDPDWKLLAHVARDLDIPVSITDPFVSTVLEDFRYLKSFKSSSPSVAKQPLANGDIVHEEGDTGASANVDKLGAEQGELSDVDIMQTLIKAVNKRTEMDTFMKLKNEMEISYSTDAPSGKPICDKAEDKLGKENGDNKVQDDLQELENGFTLPTQVEQGSVLDSTPSDQQGMPPNHRSLCIRAYDALNTRLMQIKQQVNRKWLIHKFACDENISDADLFEKMQEKMIESVESGNGQLKLMDEDEEKLPVPGKVDAESVASECMKELESLERLRNSCEAPALDQPVDCEGQTGSLSEGVTSEDKIADNNNKTTSDKIDQHSVSENDIVEFQRGEFTVCSEAPMCHRFKFEEVNTVNQKAFMTAVRKEWTLLRNGLPSGIHVKVFEDRMDLISVLIEGPECTPYEGGLFAFDVHLPAEFPAMPPVFHYWAFCKERMNPNLYEDGKVCVSLLGTWTGKGSEVWTVGSSLLQVLVSIQGLILVKEPYYNEAGYERQRGSQHGKENSRMYNEMATLKLVQSMAKMAVTPPGIFVDETKHHLKTTAQRLTDRVEGWIDISNKSRLQTGSQPATSQTGSQQTTSESGPQPATSHSGSLQATSQSGSPETHSDVDQPPADSKGGSKDTATLTQDSSEKHSTSQQSGEFVIPDFPLLPASKGFCLAVRKHLDHFKEVVDKHIFNDDIPLD